MSTKNKSAYIIPILLIIMAGGLFIFNRPNAGTTGTGQLTKPLDLFDSRDKLLTFGMFVTPDPEQNPIDPPERFTGYHTALDVETFDHEIDKEVEVCAVCDGNVLRAETAEGYGGVLIQSCRLQNQEVTVLYGHLDPASLTKRVGESIKSGEKLGLLGDEASAESGFTRKHLHLGIHKGPEPELLGYVRSESDLASFIDPLPLFE